MGRSRSRDRHKRRRSTSREKRYRSRSRSPRRRRSRSRSRGRSSKRDRERDRSRDRGYRERERERERDKEKGRAFMRSKTPEEESVTKATISGEGESSGEEKLTEEELEMKKMMGFSKFKTTKGKHVPGSSNASAMNIKTEKKYRQYMNRRGGFNRPLDPMN